MAVRKTNALAAIIMLHCMMTHPDGEYSLKTSLEDRMDIEVIPHAGVIGAIALRSSRPCLAQKLKAVLTPLFAADRADLILLSGLDAACAGRKRNVESLQQRIAELDKQLAAAATTA